MKLSQIVALSAAALTSAGCAGSGGITPTNVASAIQTIQQDARAICAVLPAADSVAQLITAEWAVGAGAVVTADAIAKAICAAVAAPAVAARIQGAQRSVVVHVVGPKGSADVTVKLQ